MDSRIDLLIAAGRLQDHLYAAACERHARSFVGERRAAERRTPRRRRLTSLRPLARRASR